MSDLVWTDMNDALFVVLVADLLQQMGFIEIQPQGSGPDGGLDLLEPVPKVAFSEFRAGVGPQPEPAWEVIHNLPPKKSLNLVF